MVQPCYRVVGGGSSQVNGDYVRASTSDGIANYSNGDVLLSRVVGEEGHLCWSLCAYDDDTTLYQSKSDGDVPPSHQWQVKDGVPPAPEVVAQDSAELSRGGKLDGGASAAQKAESPTRSLAKKKKSPRASIGVRSLLTLLVV